MPGKGIPCKVCGSFRSMTLPCSRCARLAKEVAPIVVPDSSKIVSGIVSQERPADVVE